MSSQPVEVKPKQKKVRIKKTVDKEDKTYIIPCSRIKNYISKNNLNKDLNSQIKQIKENPEIDLETILTLEQKSQLGSLIKEKEKEKKEFKMNELAKECLAKNKYKFSNTSFKVLSIFMDKMIKEVTQHAMEELVKEKKAIVNTKFVYLNEDVNAPLYHIYSSLPTYISGKEVKEEVVEEEVVEETVEEEVVEEEKEGKDNKSINFEFYIKKICKELKQSKEEFAKIKVSDNYQKFCSKLILDYLDKIMPMISIILDVKSTKTITDNIFIAIIKLHLIDSKQKEKVSSELEVEFKKVEEDKQKKKVVVAPVAA